MPVERLVINDNRHDMRTDRVRDVQNARGCAEKGGKLQVCVD
jgi:hypothetical protein